MRPLRTRLPRSLPYGRKRALEIATTLALDPQLLLLDEPTAGMAHEDVERTIALIKSVSAGRTVLMVEHNLSVVEGLCEYVIVMTRGSILAEGSYAEVSRKSRRDRGLYRCRRCLKSAISMPGTARAMCCMASNFDVHAGEVVTLLGRNGAGKSTTLKSIMGLISSARRRDPPQRRRTRDRRSDQIARAGIAYCPEERGIYTSLDVTENLLLPPVLAAGGLDMATIYGMFPNLKERARSQGSKLSGGEQQMLAIARILRTGAQLLLLDEPTEGLAPVIVRQIGRTIADIKARGFTILLVEQNFRFARSVADRHYVMENGAVVDMIPNDQLATNMSKLQNYLGV